MKSGFDDNYSDMGVIKRYLKVVNIVYNVFFIFSDMKIVVERYYEVIL